MVSTSCGRRPSSDTADLSALSTPKSPQPGHQSGSALPLNSFTGSGARLGRLSSAVLVSVIAGSAIGAPPSDPDLVHRDVLLRLAGEHLPHALDHVVGQERLAVVLADVGVRDDPCLGAQVARELAAVVVLDDDDPARLPQRLLDGLDVQRDHPLDLKVVGADPF